MSDDKSNGEQQFLTTSEMKEIRKTAEQWEGMNAAQRAAVPFTDGIVENRKKEIDARIAEIELDSEQEKIIIPDFISEEITGIKMFSNYQLSINPFSSWSSKDIKKFS